LEVDVEEWRKVVQRREEGKRWKKNEKEL